MGEDQLAADEGPRVGPLAGFVAAVHVAAGHHPATSRQGGQHLHNKNYEEYGTTLKLEKHNISNGTAFKMALRKHCATTVPNPDRD
ncbi:MAG: hypothetical protein FJ333_07135 [Sphingomonadales bacterium]|nr:hypothetical protein [Sphingomonadales bacterium]